MKTYFSITDIPRRIEISFWSTLIPWMESSHLLRFIIQEFYPLHCDFNLRAFLIQSIAWAMTGTTLGFGLGYLARLL